MYSILGHGDKGLVEMGMNSDPDFYPAPRKPSIYLIGSLRNPVIREIANTLRSRGHVVFDDWHASGPHADDIWRDYEKQRGRTYLEALKGSFARNAFNYDKQHLQEADVAILVAPAGKSGHLELGYMIGQGKRGYILLDSPDRWDMMYLFATGVFESFENLVEAL